MSGVLVCRVWGAEGHLRSGSALVGAGHAPPHRLRSPCLARLVSVLLAPLGPLCEEAGWSFRGWQNRLVLLQRKLQRGLLPQPPYEAS